jgi:ubiquinone/menaquinone biosynthesis C-methylase UbiE
MPTGMIERASHTGRIRELYTRLAPLYDLVSSYELPHHREAVRRAALAGDEHVLEVACGTGRASAEIAKHLDRGGRLVAVDLTPAMLSRAHRRLKRLGLGDRVETGFGDARKLTFADATFDVLYNSYMFDLIDGEVIPSILSEFRRVLKPGGRLVLVNSSKRRRGRTLYEFLYEKGLLGFLSGGCRPVLLESLVADAGFRDLKRVYRDNRGLFAFNRLFGTEIITATRP